MSLSITCWGLAAVLCLLKLFVYVPHFRFASHLLAQQLIRVVYWPDSLCPTHGRFKMLNRTYPRVDRERPNKACHGRRFGTHQIEFGRQGTLRRPTNEDGRFRPGVSGPLEGEAIYEIELKLPTVTPASMSIGVAL